ncbi:MAG: PEP-CTERM sorting domain-containing protein [Planctomycetes bacterium]|nr:PEP-CTERM sorting domain-containing protein [Planctomycetota bacterium]MBU4398940.1 PEP-CTERM sorting domain-containing protein [Planctomycetota bacterium]MCG2683132.1 PEP-CTERM sorting domain-containing protein [Planctomycetales bacterium]
MKTLLSALIVLALACPLYADVVLLSEDFGSGGTPAVGSALRGYNGWFGYATDDVLKISDAVADVGQSAAFNAPYGTGYPAGRNWPEVSKSFSHFGGGPVAGEVYTLSATIVASTSGYHGMGVELSTTTTGWADGTFVTAWYGPAQGGYGNKIWAGSSIDGAMAYSTPALTNGVAYDMKAVVSTASTDFYYKVHTDSTWTLMGTGSGQTLSSFQYVNIIGVVGTYNWSGTGIPLDTVVLSSNIPEPSTLALLATGLLGLLCYAWRKRR